MGFSQGSRGGPMSEINVTPLVDVMLVLLIIFMVTAPLMQAGVKVDLPEANAQPMPAQEERLILTLTADKRAYLGKDEVPLDRLGEALAAAPQVRRDKELYLHADQSLPYGVVVQVMAIAKQAGADNLAMVTDPVASAPIGDATTENPASANPAGTPAPNNNASKSKKP